MKRRIVHQHADEAERISLCEALDRILNKGAVVIGEITISVANIDLLYLGLQLVLTSVETARGRAMSDSVLPGRCALHTNGLAETADAFSMADSRDKHPDKAGEAS